MFFYLRHALTATRTKTACFSIEMVGQRSQLRHERLRKQALNLLPTMNASVRLFQGIRLRVRFLFLNEPFETFVNLTQGIIGRQGTRALSGFSDPVFLSLCHDGTPTSSFDERGGFCKNGRRQFPEGDGLRTVRIVSDILPCLSIHFGARCRGNRSLVLRCTLIQHSGLHALAKGFGKFMNKFSANPVVYPYRT